MKKLAVAAMFLGVSHFIKFKTGDKKIPPPIPTIPDKKPIEPPSNDPLSVEAFSAISTSFFLK